MENQTDDAEVLETQQTEDQQDNGQSQEQTTDAPQITAEELQQLREKAAKADDLEGKNSQLFERLKKAEKKPAPSQDQLSNKDILYLAKADIHADDLDDVLEMAKLKKLSVSEAHDFIKPILETRAQHRAAAAATNTRGSANGSAKVSGESLLAKAERTGEVPESEEELQAIFAAKTARRFPKKRT